MSIYKVDDTSLPHNSTRVTMTFLLSLLVVMLVTTGMSNPLSHSDGDSTTGDAIANLTAAINQLLTRSYRSSCPPCKDGSNPTSPIQLVVSQQLLSNSPTKCNKMIKELTETIATNISRLETRLYNEGIIKILEIVDDLNRSIARIEDNIDNIKEDVNTLKDNHENITTKKCPPTSLILPHSCKEVKRRCPDCPSDYYIIADSHGHARHVYCYMGELCNCEGGWTRVAYLNMTDSSEKCPNGFRLYSDNGVRACGRPVSSGGSCVGVTFPSGNIEYSQVCGKVIGYQVGFPDGAYPSTGSINSHYCDGISLTHGNPRNHIWTFICGTTDNYLYSRCPCGSKDPRTPPSFVGNDYYCESGSPNYPVEGKFYTNDPLWDGHQCGSIETACCQRTGIPWFNKKFNCSTTDNIEMRICLSEGTSDEDCAVAHYEIYVK